MSFYWAEQMFEQIPALSTQIIDQASLGRQVALLFAGGNPQQPVVMGFIHSPLDVVIGQTLADASDASALVETEIFSGPAQFTPPERKADLDGKRLVLRLKKRCKLNAASRVLICIRMAAW